MEILAIMIMAVVLHMAGVFEPLVSWFKKSDAAVGLQKLLEQQQPIMFDGDPVRTAGEFIQDAWMEKPDVMNGRAGGRPHKVSVIIYSLALAARNLEQNNDINARGVYAALLSAIGSASQYSHTFNFKEVDENLMSEIKKMIQHLHDKYEAECEDTMEQLGAIGVSIS